MKCSWLVMSRRASMSLFLNSCSSPDQFRPSDYSPSIPFSNPHRSFRVVIVPHFLLSFLLVRFLFSFVLEHTHHRLPTYYFLSRPPRLALLVTALYSFNQVIYKYNFSDLNTTSTHSSVQNYGHEGIEARHNPPKHTARE